MHYQASYHCDWLELDSTEKRWEGCKMQASELSWEVRKLEYLCTNTWESQFEGFGWECCFCPFKASEIDLGQRVTFVSSWKSTRVHTMGKSEGKGWGTGRFCFNVLGDFEIPFNTLFIIFSNTAMRFFPVFTLKRERRRRVW